MNLDDYREKRAREDAERTAAMPVWLVKWKSDGKYLASDRANEWTDVRSAAFRFPTRTNADATRKHLGAPAFYTKLVRLMRTGSR
jgi:hypothetical protein